MPALPEKKRFFLACICYDYGWSFFGNFSSIAIVDEDYDFSVLGWDELRH